MIIDTGALDTLEAHITSLTEQALAALETMPVTDAAKDELRLLAGYVSWRDI